MAVYVRVERRFWHDEKIRAVDEDARTLALYLLTSPHGNMLGLYVLPEMYARADLGGWEALRYQHAFAQLLDQGFVQNDGATDLVWVVNQVRHNPPETGCQAKAAIKLIPELPRSELCGQLAEVVGGLGKAYLVALVEALAAHVPGSRSATASVTPGVTGGATPGDTASPVPVSVPVSVAGEGEGSPPAPPQGAPRRARPVFEEGTEPYRLARLLRDSIIDHLGDDARVPGPTPADLGPWAREFDLMIRLDGLDPPRIEQVLRWARADPFWQGNILSPGKFRKQWTTLVAQMARPHDDRPGGGDGGRGANRSGIDRSKLNDLIVRG